MKSIYIIIICIIGTAMFTLPFFLKDKSDTTVIKVKQQGSYRYIAVPVGPQGWGYRIYKDEKLYIFQRSIPAISGTIPFASEADAEKVAKRVMAKLESGQSPAMSKEELKELKIIE